MSWGWKITLLFTGFVCFILFMVFRSLNQDFHLVADDYYKQEIEYQKVIDGIRNAKQLGDEFAVNYDSRTHKLLLQFPEDHKNNIQGEIHFFRPSDSDLDIKIAIRADQKGAMKIPTENLKRGLWKIKILWDFNGEHYHFEKDQIL